MAHQPGAATSRDIVARWCALAEQRLEYLTELFETGRWRRFHNETAFLENIQEAKTAVETWRDLSSREASRDNLAINMSWLGRTTSARPRDKIWRDPPNLPQPVEIPGEQPHEDAIVLEAKPACAGTAFSAQATGDSAAELAHELAAVVGRYPLLRNAL
ncbi:MAG TPA: TIGR03809 family protein [Bradyrhizobium sp.]|nr:TIGR03809 family protein [Bradyrhizobium sp.]